jgi:hypothetical protein
MEKLRDDLAELHSKELKELQDRLQKDLADERALRELEKKRNDALKEMKLTQGKIITDLDAQVQSKFPTSFPAYPLQLRTGFYLYRNTTSFSAETFPDSQHRAIEAVNRCRGTHFLPPNSGAPKTTLPSYPLASHIWENSGGSFWPPLSTPAPVSGPVKQFQLALSI